MYSCGFKHHLETPLGPWMLRLMVSKERKIWYQRLESKACQIPADVVGVLGRMAVVAE